MNASRTPTVAPVNSKATHMLGINIAPKRIIATSPMLMIANLKLSEAKGLAEGKRRPSKLSLNGKKAWEILVWYGQRSLYEQHC